jgi:hypothetical protein
VGSDELHDGFARPWKRGFTAAASLSRSDFRAFVLAFVLTLDALFLFFFLFLRASEARKSYAPPSYFAYLACHISQLTSACRIPSRAERNVRDALLVYPNKPNC